MKKRFLSAAFILCMVFIFQQVSAQYTTGIGLRLGRYYGGTVKHFFGADNGHGFEAIVARSNSWRGIHIIAMYELQRPIMDSRSQIRWDWILGVGPQFGFYRGADYYIQGTGYTTGNVTTIGVSAIAGMEMIFPGFPISAGFDIRPYYDFVNGGKDNVDFALSLRYVFGK